MFIMSQAQECISRRTHSHEPSYRTMIVKKRILLMTRLGFIPLVQINQLQQIDRYKKATEENSVLQRIKEYTCTCNEWPVHKSSCPKNILPYWPIWTEIHEQDGLPFAG